MTTYSADYVVYRDDLAYMQDSSQKGNSNNNYYILSEKPQKTFPLGVTK